MTPLTFIPYSVIADQEQSSVTGKICEGNFTNVSNELLKNLKRKVSLLNRRHSTIHSSCGPVLSPRFDVSKL